MAPDDAQAVYPLPTHMRDRWANRPEPPEGQGTVYWHALMSAYPEAQAAAKSAQSILADFDGFHLTPSEWLHMTMLLVDSTEKVPHNRLPDILDAARSALAGVDTPAITLEHVLYHPEAIILEAKPAHQLREIRQRIDRATSDVLGSQPDNEGTQRWVPHMTVSYSTAQRPADPIIAALGHSIPARTVHIEEITLVIQWGPEREWDWEIIGTLNLGLACEANRA